MVALLKPEQGFEPHAVANLFPPMSDDEFSALRADISANGLREPIWIYDGKIIDGRNRYRACLELKIEPETREWDGKGSLVSFVVSQNLHRRHLSSSQRAMLGAEIERELAKEARERQRAGGKVKEKIPQPAKGQAREQAAKISGTNSHYISDAKKISTKAPEVAERVKQGKMEMQDAKALVNLNDDQRSAALKVLDNGYAESGREAAAIVLTQNPHNPKAVEQAASIPANEQPRREPSEGERWSKNLTELSRKVMSVHINGGMKQMAARWSESLLLNNYESVCFMLNQLNEWKSGLEEVMKEKGVKHETKCSS